MSKKLWVENIVNNPSIVWQENAPNVDFADYTGDIIAWNTFGKKVLDFNRYRTIMNPLFYAQAGAQLQNWGTLSAELKSIGAALFFVPYSLRVPAIFSDEVDKENWRDLLIKTEGSSILNLVGRARDYQEMRMWVGDYLRRDLMTLTQTQLFYKDIFTLVEWFIASNCPDFKYWLTNAVGTAYENAGYQQATCIPDGVKAQLLIELMDIYRGNY